MAGLATLPIARDSLVAVAVGDSRDAVVVGVADTRADVAWALLDDAVGRETDGRSHTPRPGEGVTLFIGDRIVVVGIVEDSDGDVEVARALRSAVEALDAETW